MRSTAFPDGEENTGEADKSGESARKGGCTSGFPAGQKRGIRQERRMYLRLSSRTKADIFWSPISIGNSNCRRFLLGPDQRAHRMAGQGRANMGKSEHARVQKRGQKQKSTPGGIRTPNPRFRRPMLYPVELRVHHQISAQCIAPAGHYQDAVANSKRFPEGFRHPAGPWRPRKCQSWRRPLARRRGHPEFPSDSRPCGPFPCPTPRCFAAGG